MTGADDLTAHGRAERTPRRLFRPHVARERFDVVARLRDRLGRPPLALCAGYSFKTNPRPEMLALARERGFCAETISAEELDWAAEHGFAAAETIYNGPEPLRDPAPPHEPIGLVFADSIEAFARNAARDAARLPGIRLRPSMIESRFGVSIDDDSALLETVAALAPPSIGVSFHVRRGDFKAATWRDVAGDVLDRAVVLEQRTGRRIAAFDVGGGWTPEEFDRDFAPDVRWIVERIVAALPSCTRLVFEAGQALCTPAEALLTEVLEVRERRGRRDAVVDLGYSDWPEMHAYVHGFFASRGDRWEPLGRGPDRLLGRTCLEYDLIEGLRFPHDLSVGDRLLVTGTGSYDRAMAFDFARGAANATLD